MSLKNWEKISEKILLRNNYWEYRLDKFRIGENISGDYHYVHTQGSTMVVPLLNNGLFLMVKQFRYLNSKESIEFPCGSIQKNLSATENAIKELREEAGVNAKNIFKIGQFNPYNGVTDEICEIFLARDLFPSPLPKDSTEDFETLQLTTSEIDSLIKNNILWDGMTIAAWQLFKIKMELQ